MGVVIIIIIICVLKIMRRLLYMYSCMCECFDWHDNGWNTGIITGVVVVVVTKFHGLVLCH